MSDVKVEDLSPAPFFARFLEDQFARPLTEEEMKAVGGGTSALEQDLVLTRQPMAPAEFPEWMRPWLDGGFPGGPPPGVPLPLYSPVAKAPETTMAYPSDNVGV